MLAYPVFLGRPRIVAAVLTACGLSKADVPRLRYEKDLVLLNEVIVLALPIFPGSHPPSIVGVHELNFCVRDGNRWTLMTINTNYLDGS